MGSNTAIKTDTGKEKMTRENVEFSMYIMRLNLSDFCFILKYLSIVLNSRVG
jgi:hypothetical protein